MTEREELLAMFRHLVDESTRIYRICPDCKGTLRGEDDDLWCPDAECGYTRRWDGQSGQWIKGPSRAREE